MSDLHFIEKGAGRPVVLLHGFPADSRIWDEQIGALSDQYRVIAVDLPGFGKSAAIGDFTMDSAAMAVHGLLKKIGALPCVLGGLSMGGYVALAFYQQCPMDVRGLMLVDTRACGDTAEGKHHRDQMIEELDRCGAQAVVDSMMPKVLADTTVAAQPHVVERVRKMMLECSPAAMKQALAGMRDRPDRTELLASIAEPALIIVGECDGITPPEQAETMRGAMPHAKLVVIADAGHFSPVENPEAVNAAMIRFLSDFGD